MNWIPDAVLEEMVDGVELVEDLETFDERITERGWTFDEDQSDEEFVIWFYPPSGADVDEGVEPVTTIWMHVDGERRDRAPDPGRDRGRPAR